MPGQNRWVRHHTDQGIRWSPLPSDDTVVRRSGPTPELSAMDSFGPVDVEELTILPPADPKRVVAIAKNRPSEELEPLVFLMTPSSVVGPGQEVRIPTDRGDTWSEVELAFVVNKNVTNVAKDEAEQFIRGYTIANDITTENIGDRDWHLARGKALDTYCPTGPILVTGIDTSDLSMKTRVNGELTQDTSSSELLLNAAGALELISSLITLEPGDLVLTGTPTSPLDSTLHPGDETTVEIEGIGSLTNPIVEKE